MTIKTSEIENLFNLLEILNEYASQQINDITSTAYFKDGYKGTRQQFYEKLQHDSFELWAGLKNEIKIREQGYL